MNTKTIKLNPTRYIKIALIIFNILFFYISISSAAASGTTHYVAINGNDNNPGTEAQPWRTIQKSADSLSPGDIVYIRKGTYEEQVWVHVSGNSDNWITFSNYPGETPIIDGANLGDLGRDNGLFNVADQSYIEVKGFKIINSGYSALFARRSNNVIFKDNTIIDSWAAAIIMFGQGDTWSNNYIIDGNYIDGGHIGPDPMAHENIVIGHQVDGFEIKNNFITHSYVGLINSKAGVKNGKIYRNTCTQATFSCVYVDGYDGGAENIDVYENLAYDMLTESSSDICSGINIASEQGSLTKNIKVYNNIIYNNPGSAMRIAGYSTGPVQDIVITSNTFVNNGNGFSNQGGILLEYGAATGIIVRNNIVSDNNAYQIRSLDGDATIENNLIDGFRGYQNEVRGSYYVEGNPEFIDPTNRDFHLKSISPALDKGSFYNSPSMDFDGNSRPIGPGYDIGIYEYGGSSPLPQDNVPSVDTSHSPSSPTTLDTVTIITSATDDIGLSEINIYTDGNLMKTCMASSTISTCSYSSTFTTGTHSYYATAKDNAGQTTISSIKQFIVSSSSSSQTPYSGTPLQVPGTIQAEDFDNGGEGIAYHDFEIQNLGGVYRTDEDVDIELTTDSGNGYNVGYIKVGDWLEYTTDVTSTGTYDIEVRVASNGPGGNFHIEFDGVDKTGILTIPDTGGWQSWTTVTKTDVSLNAGTQIMRIVIDNNSPTGGDAGNINYVRISQKIPDNPPSLVVSHSPSNPTTSDEVIITASTTDDNGLSEISIYVDSILSKMCAVSGTSSSCSYQLTFTEGTHDYYATAKDNAGQTTTSSIEQLIVGSSRSIQTPYGGTPLQVPGTIQAEDFDNGGEGIAYHDFEIQNLGGVYRTDEGVDIELTTDSGNGYNVGWSKTGEWLEYTTDVTSTGTYDIEVRVASNGPGRNIHIEFDGVDKTGTLTIPDTGGWQSWTTVTKTDVSLNAGTQIMRIVMDANSPAGGDAGNINYVKISQKTPDNPPSVIDSHSPSNPTTSDEVIITASATDDNGLSEISIYVDSTQKKTCNVSGTSSSCSYRSTFTEGTHDYYATAKDIAGQTTTSSIEQLVVGSSSSIQTPYRGTPLQVPGTIQAEDFDNGGEGIAYHDFDIQNLGGIYRTEEGVDIESTTDSGNGYNVGWIQAGDWLEYTTDVTSKGRYDIEVRVASNGPGGTFHIEFNGVDKTGTLTIPDTGGLQSWTTIKKKRVRLNAGSQTMKIVFDANSPIRTDSGNINYLKISKT